jgi:hypothetical protein
MTAKHEKEEMELMEYVVKIHSSLAHCVWGGGEKNLVFNSVIKRILDDSVKKWFDDESFNAGGYTK